MHPENTCRTITIWRSPYQATLKSRDGPNYQALYTVLRYLSYSDTSSFHIQPIDIILPATSVTPTLLRSNSTFLPPVPLPSAPIIVQLPETTLSCLPMSIPLAAKDPQGSLPPSQVPGAEAVEGGEVDPEKAARPGEADQVQELRYIWVTQPTMEPLEESMVELPDRGERRGGNDAEEKEVVQDEGRPEVAVDASAAISNTEVEMGDLGGSILKAAEIRQDCGRGGGAELPSEIDGGVAEKGDEDRQEASDPLVGGPATSDPASEAISDQVDIALPFQSTSPPPPPLPNSLPMPSSPQPISAESHSTESGLAAVVAAPNLSDANAPTAAQRAALSISSSLSADQPAAVASPVIATNDPATESPEILPPPATEHLHDSILTPTVHRDSLEIHDAPNPPPDISPPPRPTFSTSASHAPMSLANGLKRKDHMNDLFSSLAPVKRKKVELAPAPRRPQRDIERADSLELPDVTVDHGEPDLEYGYEGGEPDSVESAGSPIYETAKGSPVVEAREVGSGVVAEEDAQKGQWRVGKRPGHQGSHIRRPEAEEGTSEAEMGPGKRGQKRSLGQSITDSAEKVLKKPFRLPARVTLKPLVKPRERTPPTPPHTSSDSFSPPHNTVDTDVGSSPIKNPFSKKTPNAKLSSKPFAIPRKIDKPPSSPPGIPPTPPSTSSLASTSTATPASLGSHTTSSPFKASPTYSKRLSRPFKTPFSRSAAPSPASLSHRSAARTTRDLLLELEKEERTLRNAIKYYTQPEEDERLVELISIWRTAGQTVAELLFDIQPRPDDQAGEGGGGIGGMGMPGMGGGGGGGGAGSFFGNDKPFFSPMEEFTPEQLRALARMPTNQDGDPVDDEGNPIFGGGGDLAAEPDFGGARRDEGSVRDGDDESREDGAIKAAAASEDWTIGTMLARMGVEPGMYAWDADAEDWGVPEED